MSHDEGRDDEFSDASNAAPSPEAGMQQQRPDTFVDMCCRTLCRYWILAANVGDDFIEFRQGPNGPDKFAPSARYAPPSRLG
jgi:hypothetical protein